MPAAAAPPRVARRPRRSAADQARLRRDALQAAGRIFAAEGMDALTIRRVADTLGIGPTSLYRHFPSKTHLLRAVWDELLAESLRTAQAAAEARTEPCERPAAFVDGFVGHWLDHPEQYLLVFTTGNERLAARLGLPPYGSQVAVRKHFEAVTLLIERCCRRRLPDATLDDLLELMFCRSFGLLHPVLYFPSYPWRDIGALRRALFDELVQRMRRIAA